jgi:hypothetical protein
MRASLHSEAASLFRQDYEGAVYGADRSRWSRLFIILLVSGSRSLAFGGTSAPSPAEAHEHSSASDVFALVKTFASRSALRRGKRFFYQKWQ